MLLIYTYIGTNLQLGQPQSTGLQLGGQKQTVTAGGGLQLGQNTSLLSGTQQGQAKLQPTSGGLQLGQQPSTAAQGLGLQLGNPLTLGSTALQTGGTSGLPAYNAQPTTSKTGQTGLQLGNLGQQKLPSSTITSQPQKAAGISLTGGIGTSAAGIGTSSLSISKPPPAYTAPSSTGPTTVIPATSIASSAPTGGKKYTYKQLEKMINEVCWLDVV